MPGYLRKIGQSPLEQDAYRLIQAIEKIRSAGGGGGIQSIVAGTGISVDNTDPQNPIVTATGGAGLRFGVAGEDNLAAENRDFSLNGFEFVLSDSGNDRLLVSNEHTVIYSGNGVGSGSIDTKSNLVDGYNFSLIASDSLNDVRIIGDAVADQISIDASITTIVGLNGNGTGLVGVDDDGDLEFVGFNQLASTLGTGALLFADPCNIDHGVFWTATTTYGACYYEAWVMPTIPNLTGYFISDGAGGSHNVLLGVITTPDDATFTGNFRRAVDNTQEDMSAPGDIIPLGDWVHLAWAYDQSNVYLLINGMAAYRKAYTGDREFQPGDSNGHLYGGGSYHNNFPGYVKSIRGKEGVTGITVNNRFIPRDFDRTIISTNGSSTTPATFVSDYSVNGTRLFIDGGFGFDGTAEDVESPHHGRMTRFNDATVFPSWHPTGDVVPSTFVPVAPITPVGALVFDSFSRVNNLNILDNVATLGSTEAGSLGPLAWNTSTGAWGILYGQATMYLAQNPQVLLETTSVTDADVRVSKPPYPYISTGVVVRYKDGLNYFRVYSHYDNDTSILLEFMQAGVQTFPGPYAVAGGWTELKVIVNGTLLEVYTDGVLAGDETISNVAGSTQYGMYAQGYVNRFDDFTILPA